MRIRYPFAGVLAALVLLSAYAGLSRLQIAAVNDKLLHFVDFFLITLTLYWTLDLPRRLVLKLVLGASAALAVGSEILQAAVPNNGRVFDPVDIAANILGSALALGLCNWYHKRMLERKRQQKLQGYGLVDRNDTDDVELGEASSAGQDLGVIPEDDDGGEAWDEIGGSDAARESSEGSRGIHKAETQ